MQALEDSIARHRRAKERFLAGRPAGSVHPALLRTIIGRDEHQAIAQEMLAFL